VSIGLEALARRAAFSLGLPQEGLPLSDVISQLRKADGGEGALRQAVIEAAATTPEGRDAVAASDSGCSASGSAAGGDAAVPAGGGGGASAADPTTAESAVAAAPAAAQGRAAGGSGFRQLRCRPQPGLSCAHCGGRGVERFQVCASCDTVRYCNRDCQRAHWPAHRGKCRALKEAKEAQQQV
jgi:hypothetical protein